MRTNIYKVLTILCDGRGMNDNVTSPLPPTPAPITAAWIARSTAAEVLVRKPEIDHMLSDTSRLTEATALAGAIVTHTVSTRGADGAIIRTPDGLVNHFLPRDAVVNGAWNPGVDIDGKGGIKNGELQSLVIAYARVISSGAALNGVTVGSIGPQGSEIYHQILQTLSPCERKKICR